MLYAPAFSRTKTDSCELIGKPISPPHARRGFLSHIVSVLLPHPRRKSCKVIAAPPLRHADSHGTLTSSGDISFSSSGTLAYQADVSSRFGDAIHWGRVRLKLLAVARFVTLRKRVAVFSSPPPPSAPLFPRMRWEEVRYQAGGTLGSGAFATVVECNLGKSTFAMKIARKRSSDSRQRSKAGMSLRAATCELAVLARLGRHPTLLGLVDRFETHEAFVFVLELASGGDVFDRICERGPYAEAEAARVVRQVAEGVLHLGTVGVCHRDIKPENLMYASSHPHAPIKITDFGLATFCGEGHPPIKSVVGTPAYSAPELLDPDTTYGKEVDMWSTGVVLFVLLGGYNPFDAFSDAANSTVISRVVGGRWRFEASRWGHISQLAKDAVSGMLRADPTRRTTPSQLLCSPWIVEASHESLHVSDANIKTFHEDKRLWREAGCALGLIGLGSVSPHCHSPLGVDQHISAQAEAEMRAAFNRFDLDKSGSLSKSDLRRAMLALNTGNHEPTLEEVERCFDGVDTDGNGAIDFVEFQQALAPLYNDSLQALRGAFQLLDVNSKGYIYSKEFEHTLDRLGQLKSFEGEAHARAFAQSSFSNKKGRGKIFFEDFAEAFGVSGLVRGSTFCSILNDANSGRRSFFGDAYSSRWSSQDGRNNKNTKEKPRRLSF